MRLIALACLVACARPVRDDIRWVAPISNCHDAFYDGVHVEHDTHSSTPRFTLHNDKGRIGSFAGHPLGTLHVNGRRYLVAQDGARTYTIAI